MIDYLNDINENDLQEYAQKMYQEEIEQLPWWDLPEEEENENNIKELGQALIELQKIVKKDNNSQLAILYYYIVNKYLK